MRKSGNVTLANQNLSEFMWIVWQASFEQLVSLCSVSDIAGKLFKARVILLVTLLLSRSLHLQARPSAGVMSSSPSPLTLSSVLGISWQRHFWDFLRDQYLLLLEWQFKSKEAIPRYGDDKMLDTKFSFCGTVFLELPHLQCNLSRFAANPTLSTPCALGAPILLTDSDW